MQLEPSSVTSDRFDRCDSVKRVKDEIHVRRIKHTMRRSKKPSETTASFH